MKQSLLPTLILLCLQTSSFAQTDTSFHTTFEVQAGIGIVNLLGYKGGPINDDNSMFISENSISDIDISGSTAQLGAIFSRRLWKTIWLRSGLQMTYLHSKAKYRVKEVVAVGSSSTARHFDAGIEINIKSFGVQMPIQIEYRKDFENWGIYSNLGTTLSFSYPGIYMQVRGFSETTHVQQHGVAGSFELGVILSKRNWLFSRIGYQVTTDLVPFNQGNNPRDKIYLPNSFPDRDYGHLIYQLNLSLLWPEREIILDQSINNQRWTGWFISSSVSLQIPFHNEDRYLAGRQGVGWGRNLQVKWIGSGGLGLRLQSGVWITPASDFNDEVSIVKAEFLYQLPYGLELSTGISNRTEASSGWGNTSYKGLLLGTGGMIPLNSRFGLELNLSGHYVPKYSDEKILMEAGIGIVYNVF